jgi:sulfur carrier protein ThiS
LEVKVTLHGILRDYLPRQAKGRTTLELAEGTTIEAVVQRLEIKQNVSAAIDGIEVQNSHVLQNGEELHLFRLIAGG